MSHFPREHILSQYYVVAWDYWRTMASSALCLFLIFGLYFSQCFSKPVNNRDTVPPLDTSKLEIFYSCSRETWQKDLWKILVFYGKLKPGWYIYMCSRALKCTRKMYCFPRGLAKLFNKFFFQLRIISFFIHAIAFYVYLQWSNRVLKLGDCYCSAWLKLSKFFVLSLHVASHNNWSWNYSLKRRPCQHIPQAVVIRSLITFNFRSSCYV